MSRELRFPRHIALQQRYPDHPPCFFRVDLFDRGQVRRELRLRILGGAIAARHREHAHDDCECLFIDFVQRDRRAESARQTRDFDDRLLDHG